MVENKISVMIPVLNGGLNLRACLRSVCNQDISIYEYIIVDNNSTDDTKAIIEEFQVMYENMHYVFEKVRTRGAARNAGVLKASGDVVVMTDVDCVVPVDWARRMTEQIVQGHEKMVCGGQYNLVGNYWSRNMQKMGDYFMKTAISHDGYVVFCDTKNFAIKTTLIKSMMFDSRFKALENVEFDYRMRPICRVKYLADMKVGHRNVHTILGLLKLQYSRSYWMAQIYHKFKGIHDIHGVLIFPIIPAKYFYRDLFRINFNALREQGFSHLLFYIVADIGWKLGSIVGFTWVDKRFRNEKGIAGKTNF